MAATEPSDGSGAPETDRLAHLEERVRTLEELLRQTEAELRDCRESLLGRQEDLVQLTHRLQYGGRLSRSLVGGVRRLRGTVLRRGGPLHGLARKGMRLLRAAAWSRRSGR